MQLSKNIIWYNSITKKNLLYKNQYEKKKSINIKKITILAQLNKSSSNNERDILTRKVQDIISIHLIKLVLNHTYKIKLHKKNRVYAQNIESKANLNLVQQLVLQTPINNTSAVFINKKTLVLKIPNIYLLPYLVNFKPTKQQEIKKSNSFPNIVVYITANQEKGFLTLLSSLQLPLRTIK